MAYTNAWEHLTDELKRLDLLIKRRVQEQLRTQPSHPLEQFKGLVLSDEEIIHLLREGPGAADAEEASRPTVSAEEQLLSDSIESLTTRLRRGRAEALHNGVELPLERLARLFGLDAFAEQCLILCLAPELERKYEKLYAYLQDDITQKRPTVDLALTLFCSGAEERLAARRAFDARAPLITHRLVELRESGQGTHSALLSHTLGLDERILDELLCVRAVDARLQRLVRLEGPDEEPPAPYLPFAEELHQRLVAYLRAHTPEEASAAPPFLFLQGPYGTGKLSLVRAACRDARLPLLVCDLGAMDDATLHWAELSRLLVREATLQSAALCLSNFDALLTEDDARQTRLRALVSAVSTLTRPTFFLAAAALRPHEALRQRACIHIDFGVPDEGARRLLWEARLARDTGGAREALDTGALASKFRFTPGQIEDALRAARELAAWRRPSDPRLSNEDMDEACRAQTELKLGSLAQKVAPYYGWEDLVLPPDQTAQLREICQQARARHIVFGQWGFGGKLSRGTGLNVLFSGPPGTGKTMAAEVISRELRLELYKIDLSQVVSKYIGETEKNLHRIFVEAQTSNAILFFDEADALFGKRSEVKDAHDRYANIEVGYLLQKMEEYEGIAILATNLRQNMDEAFVRRMQMVVEFPFPDEEYRRRIWEVSFPAAAPLGPDVDFQQLARDIRLPGGNIRNIALAAAFHAAQNGGSITAAHLTHAARREYQKLGRTWSA